MSAIMMIITFQLTRPRGARLVSICFCVDFIDFNSRAHEERDKQYQEAEGAENDFNSRAHEERDQVLYFAVIGF